MAQVSPALAEYWLPTASRVSSRPAGPTLAASLLSIRPRQASWCGVSISGQIQAMGNGCGRGWPEQALPFVGQYGSGTGSLATLSAASPTSAVSG